MSFDKFKSVIEAGDKVFLFLGFDRMHTIVAKTGEVFQTQYGALKHSDVIGSRYGSRIPCAKGYVYALHPTPELWTNNLPHRTQILYTTDISMVTMQLDLKPGAVVVESGKKLISVSSLCNGTGSGMFINDLGSSEPNSYSNLSKCVYGY